MKNRWGVFLLLPFLLAAGASEDWLRRGNAAFARQDFDEALHCYARAEEDATDPGAVAFNEAAVLYKLGRFAEAEKYYRRCLDNARGPRRCQTLFNLGTCLLQQADKNNVDAYAAAVKCYEECLEQPGVGAAVRGRAENNLELTRLLWAQARAEEPPKQTGNQQKNKEPKTGKKNQDDGSDDSQNGSQNPKNGNGDPSRKDGSKGDSNDKQGSGKGGKLATLPDSDQLVPMTVQETRALLEEMTERMRQERQSRQRMMAPPPGRVKDW